MVDSSSSLVQSLSIVLLQHFWARVYPQGHLIVQDGGWSVIIQTRCRAKGHFSQVNKLPFLKGGHLIHCSNLNTFEMERGCF